MIVREATKDDFEVCLGLGYRFYKTTKYPIPFNGEDVRNMYEHIQKQGMFFVAEHDDKIIGMIGGITHPFWANTEYLAGAEMFWWVEPEYRSTGIGIELMNKLEERAKELGVELWSMIALEAIEPEKVGKIYKKLGYQATERTYTKRLEWH